jgi:hypothetical protein
VLWIRIVKKQMWIQEKFHADTDANSDADAEADAEADKCLY